jgi:acyl-coenzyme A thioesterase PaaI-like protein
LLTADGLTPEDEQRREAKRRLVAQARRLAEAVALVDAASMAGVDIDGLTDRIARATADLEAAPTLRDQGLFLAPGFASHLAERSPISGESNPVAAPLRLWFDGEVTRGQATYGAAYEGPPGTLHGGVVAGAFDELLGVAQAASGCAGFTGTLTVRMRRPTPLSRPIDYEGGVDRVDGRKIHAWGRSTCDGELLAEAEGIFISSADGRPPHG